MTRAAPALVTAAGTPAATALRGASRSPLGFVAAGAKALLLQTLWAAAGERGTLMSIMSTAAKQILEAALKLDPIERARVAETLLHSLSEAEIEAIEDEEDVVEARAALDEMKRTGEKPIPLEQVKRDLGLE